MSDRSNNPGSAGNVTVPHLLLSPEQLTAPLEWSSFFGNVHPVELEIGFGKGGFLVESSTARPETNFLGIENTAKMAAYTAERLEKRSRTNVRLICADAHFVLHRFLSDASLAAVHIYFPDPWPKKRHRKRRLLSEEFLTELSRVMSSGARLHFATDFKDYFEQVSHLFAQCSTLKSLDPQPWVETRHPACITNYERKYRQEGRPIFYALLQRR